MKGIMLVYFSIETFKMFNDCIPAAPRITKTI